MPATIRDTQSAVADAASVGRCTSQTWAPQASSPTLAASATGFDAGSIGYGLRRWQRRLRASTLAASATGFDAGSVGYEALPVRHRSANSPAGEKSPLG